MSKALKKALSIGVVLALMLCCLLASPVKAFAAYQDGTYGVGVSCTGGSGRGGVQSATVTVIGGNISYISLTMSSANYDYAFYTDGPESSNRISDIVYAPAGSGNSVFTVYYAGPYFYFRADTTAMSEPHEITYTVSLDISGIPQASSGGGGGYTPSGPSAEEIAKAELEKKLSAADALIEEIGDVSVGSKEAIEAARAAVDAFTEEEQKGLKKLSVLEEAEKTFAAIEKKIADADALIEKIGDDINLESEADIEAARKAVGDLTEDEAKELKNLSKLKSAEDIYKELKEEAEREAAKQAERRKIISYIVAGAAVVLILGLVIGLNLRKGKKEQ